MLLLTEGQDGLWERFQRGEHGDDALAVVPRWERMRRLGLRADGGADPVGVGATELQVRRAAALDALAEGHAVVDALVSDAAARGLLAVLADADGLVVRAHGGAAFSSRLQRARLIEGVRWDEATRGTNAIGTAIAERRSIAVIGRGHWEEVNHGLFCYAAPVRDPFGDVVGVLDVTGPLEHDDPSLAGAVQGASEAVEALVRAHAYGRSEAGGYAMIERMLDRVAGPAVLIEASGRVRAANRAAMAELAVAIDMPVERLLGLGWDELCRASGSGTATFETRRRRFAVDFEVIRLGGRILSIACFFRVAASPRRVAVAAGPTPAAFDAVFAADPAVAAVKVLAGKLARAEVPVLLLAETGTGKELFARAIHRASPRAAGPFVAVNCGALTGSLLESELFGYAPGAFTGASGRGAEGKIAAADRGTLFLDEIAEASPAAQALLLRVLEDGSYSRLGETAVRHADVRIVCATCRDLPALVRDGAFREDLFFRIHGGCVTLPPLRERTDRIELARVLLDAVATRAGRPAGASELAPSAEAWVLDHAWPGNVRELKSALAHAVAVSDGPIIGREHFPAPLVTSRAAPATVASASRRTAMRELAEAAVTRAGGNLTEAARTLGVARSTLYRMLGRSA